MHKLSKSISGLIFFLSIRTEREKIFFYSESKNYRNYFITLISSLRKKTGHEVFYFTSDLDDLDNIDKNLEPIYIGDGFIRMLFFQMVACDILIMTLTDLGENHLKKTKKCKNYLYLFHSFCSTHKVYEKFAFKNYDIIFTVGDFQTRERKKAEKIYSLPEKKLFNVGYFYLEKIYKNVNLNKKQPNNIVFAPSWSRDKKNLFKNYSLVIIKILINSGFYTTLRVHPETIKREKYLLTSLQKTFASNSKFKLNNDLNITSCFEDSEILITDNGGVAMEYCLIYKKPVLFINYKDKVHNESFKDLEIAPLEDEFKRKFGYQINIFRIESN